MSIEVCLTLSAGRSVTPFSDLVTAKRSSDFLLFKRSKQLSWQVDNFLLEMLIATALREEPRAALQAMLPVQAFLAHKKLHRYRVTSLIRGFAVVLGGFL